MNYGNNNIINSLTNKPALPSWWSRASSFNRFARDLELNPDAPSTRSSFHAIEAKEIREGYE